MMHIGKLAREAGTTTRTVRYYEEMGLITPECRTPGGFRCYSEDHLIQLRMILSLKDLEFDLERIKTILDKREESDTGGKLAAAILGDLQGRLDEVTTQVEHLCDLRTKLTRAVECLCACLPCEETMEDLLCAGCERVPGEGKEPLPFFHVVPSR